MEGILQSSSGINGLKCSLIAQTSFSPIPFQSYHAFEGLLAFGMYSSKSQITIFYIQGTWKRHILNRNAVKSQNLILTKTINIQNYKDKIQLR